MIINLDICLDFQEFLIKYLCAFYILSSMKDTTLYNELLEFGREIIKHNESLITEIERKCILDIKSNNAIVALAMTLYDYMFDQNIERQALYR